jgi:hypothetical protein
MAASAAEVAIVSICAGEVARRNQPVPRAAEVPAHCEVPPRPMPPTNKYSLLIATLLLTSFAWSDCLPFEEGHKHVGEVKCVTGKVVRVKQGSRGVHFLDFCDDFRLCPFAVVVFPVT